MRHEAAALRCCGTLAQRSAGFGLQWARLVREASVRRKPPRLSTPRGPRNAIRRRRARCPGSPEPVKETLTTLAAEALRPKPRSSLEAALATTKPTAEPRSPPSSRGAAAIMTFPALLAHSSPPLRLWRFAGVVFLVAQAISDSLSLRDTWKAKHIVEQCLLDGAPRIVDGVECNRCITKAWQKAARSRRPFTSFTRVAAARAREGWFVLRCC